MSLNGVVLACFIFGFCIHVHLCGQTCLSCTGVENRSDCQHVTTCTNDENPISIVDFQLDIETNTKRCGIISNGKTINKGSNEVNVCFVQKHTTESGSVLYDLGCAYDQFCRHSVGGIFGRRSEGHHVSCESCCNNTRTCNIDLKCESDHHVIGSTLPRECSDIQGQHSDGVYTIYPDGISPVSVFCDMHTENGKWTVIQRRLNGSVNFEQNWKTYKEGFGYPNGEYWLGNDIIHEITVHNRHELRIDMGDFDGLTKYAKYSVFSVGDEKSEYELTVLGYSGNAGDSFSYHDRKLFSTIDRDKDNSTCAQLYHGGWWYGSCHQSNLNRRYLSGTSPYGEGINWQTWHGYHYSLKSVKMMIRTLH